MIRFECDYTEGAHERIMKRLLETNTQQTPGYGEDSYCEKARELIRESCKSPAAHVHFLVGGTQTNTTFIASVLRPHQGAISAVTGHINGHESGAIEATGHKVLALTSVDGKLTAKAIEKFVAEHYADVTHEHSVQPGMVYISHPTENGTTYSREELTDISEVCRRHSLPLFMDGARLGYGMAAPDSTLSLPDIAELCSAFYIGGTKVGALFGEALVITDERLNKDFRYIIKQRGGLLAKGRLLGLQFLELFTDGLYLKISKHAVSLALEIKDAFRQKGIKFLYESTTNQQFPILGKEQLEVLGRKYSFSEWKTVDERHTAARFCTSWATKESDVRELIADINSL